MKLIKVYLVVSLYLFHFLLDLDVPIDDDSVTFVLPTSGWLRFWNCLGEVGFVVDRVSDLVVGLSSCWSLV